MKRVYIMGFSALIRSGCASTNIAPLQSASDVKTISENERRVWAEADSYDHSMRNAGQTYEIPAVLTYLQGVMDKVHPEFRGTIKVRVAHSPHLNAFALPNGVIYMNLGLIARLENKAQLATILAHEGGHFILKHGYKQRQNVKNSAAMSLFVSEILAMSSIYGDSRDLEREADLIAFEQVGKAGYDTKEAIRAFEHLAKEAKALDEKEPFFFSSHPKLAEAYQRRGDKGDEQRAIDAYLATMKVAPAFAPSYRALGIYHMKRTEYAKAETYLARYLQLAPQAPDRDHVKNHHQLSKQRGAQ